VELSQAVTSLPTGAALATAGGCIKGAGVNPCPHSGLEWPVNGLVCHLSPHQTVRGRAFMGRPLAC
jgi:hypothetical protein